MKIKKFNFLFLIGFFLSSCANHQEEQEFLKKLYTEMNDSDQLIIKIYELKGGDWKTVCFGYGPSVKMYFKGYDLKDLFKMKFQSGVMYINEEYVDGSPSERCYDLNKKFVFKRKIVLGEERILVKHFVVDSGSGNN